MFSIFNFYHQLAVVYLEFIKSLRIEKTISRLKGEPFSKSEKIVELLNCYMTAFNPMKEEDLENLGEWI